MDLGLNVFQVLQNELITREGSRQSLGLGFRLAIIEERQRNAEAIGRNGQAWRLNHALHRVSACTPESRRKVEAHREKLLSRRDARKGKDDKDPTMMPRDEEAWEHHFHFPKTVLEFKELQFYRKSTSLIAAPHAERSSQTYQTSSRILRYQSLSTRHETAQHPSRRPVSRC